jgi:hypothetical protein
MQAGTQAALARLEGGPGSGQFLGVEETVALDLLNNGELSYINALGPRLARLEAARRRGPWALLVEWMWVRLHRRRRQRHAGPEGPAWSGLGCPSGISHYLYVSQRKMRGVEDRVITDGFYFHRWRCGILSLAVRFRVVNGLRGYGIAGAVPLVVLGILPAPKIAFTFLQRSDQGVRCGPPEGFGSTRYSCY